MGLSELLYLHQTERHLTELHNFLLSASHEPSIGTEQPAQAMPIFTERSPIQRCPFCLRFSFVQLALASPKLLPSTGDLSLMPSQKISSAAQKSLSANLPPFSTPLFAVPFCGRMRVFVY